MGRSPEAVQCLADFQTEGDAGILGGYLGIVHRSYDAPARRVTEDAPAARLESAPGEAGVTMA